MRNLILLGKGENPYENLALEEALTERVREGDAALYLWQNRHTVVIGRNQNAWRECRCQLLRDEGGLLARRSTGGGAVYHDLGNLNFSFAASPERYDLEKQLGTVLDALQNLGISAQFSGRNDLVTADGRKFSGSAFKHAKNCSLHHGTLLISADMDRLSRYLNPPAEKLRAKGVASVRARVCNLSEYAGDVTVSRVRAALMDSFQTRFGPADAIFPAELDFADKAARNASWEWNYGLTPAFDVRLSRRLPWGCAEIALMLEHGAVKTCRVYSDAMDPDLPGRIEAALTGAAYGKALIEAARPFPGLAEWLAEELPV